MNKIKRFILNMLKVNYKVLLGSTGILNIDRDKLTPVINHLSPLEFNDVNLEMKGYSISHIEKDIRIDKNIDNEPVIDIRFINTSMDSPFNIISKYYVMTTVFFLGLDNQYWKLQVKTSMTCGTTHTLNDTEIIYIKRALNEFTNIILDEIHLDNLSRYPIKISNDYFDSHDQLIHVPYNGYVDLYYTSFFSEMSQTFDDINECAESQFYKRIHTY